MAPVRFLVEVLPPDTGWQALQETTARARTAAEQLRSEGLAVRFVRSVFAPEDNTCFFLYEAPSLEAVEEVVRRAELRTLGAPASPIGPKSGGRQTGRRA